MGDFDIKLLKMNKILKIKRLNSIFSTIFIFILLEVFVFFPIVFLPITCLILLSIVFSVWRIMPKNYKISAELRATDSFFVKIVKILKIFCDDRNYTFLISPIFLFFGVFSFILFIKSMVLVHLTILLFAFFYLLFLEGLFFYPDIRRDKKKSYFLENIFTVINFIALFFLYSAIFSSLSFFSFALWKATLIFIIFTYLSNHQLLHIYKASNDINYFYNIIITIIMVESFWAVVFLPTSFYVNSMILLSVYYSVIGIGYFYLQKTLNRVKVIRHLTIGLSAIVISLLTAIWT